uniref:Alternative protein n=1 Tax=Heterorhabditis bacteriophora TaxID=37862 RepID=A0A1I7WGY6_HETBA
MMNTSASMSKHAGVLTKLLISGFINTTLERGCACRSGMLEVCR